MTNKFYKLSTSWGKYKLGQTYSILELYALGKYTVSLTLGILPLATALG